MYRKILILSLVFQLFSCNSSKTESDNTYEINNIETTTLISPSKFDSIIKNKSNAVVIDVRTSEEFSKGHLENALNLDWKGTEFNNQLEAIDKNETILIYCLSGGRSAKAVEALKAKGYNNIIELEGGIMSWRKENLPEVILEKKSEGMTLADYQVLLDSEKLVLVDFNAVWCAPCIKMKPILEKIEKDYNDKVSIVKIDVDEHSNLAKELGVVGLPVLKLYKDKELIWEHKGFANETTIVNQLK